MTIRFPLVLCVLRVNRAFKLVVEGDAREHTRFRIITVQEPKCKSEPARGSVKKIGGGVGEGKLRPAVGNSVSGERKNDEFPI